jgi:uncharacterized membrane protein
VPLIGAGLALTLVLGLWLVHHRGYSLWELWILAALVLWAVAGYSNGQVAGVARDVKNGGDGKNVRVLWAVDTLGALLLLVLMVWKPGH